MPARLGMDYSMSRGGLDFLKYLLAIFMWKHVRTAAYAPGCDIISVQRMIRHEGMSYFLRRETKRTTS